MTSSTPYRPYESADEDTSCIDCDRKVDVECCGAYVCCHCYPRLTGQRFDDYRNRGWLR